MQCMYAYKQWNGIFTKLFEENSTRSTKTRVCKRAKLLHLLFTACHVLIFILEWEKKCGVYLLLSITTQKKCEIEENVSNKKLFCTFQDGKGVLYLWWSLKRMHSEQTFVFFSQYRFSIACKQFKSLFCIYLNEDWQESTILHTSRSGFIAASKCYMNNDDRYIYGCERRWLMIKRHSIEKQK